MTNTFTEFTEITEIFDLTLTDSDGTGYSLSHRRGSDTLSFTMMDKGRVIWGDDVEADSHAIEYMLTTARSVGQAIEDDHEEGQVESNFMDGFASVGDLLHMDFRLADPTSNATVVCTLHLIDEDDPEYYMVGVTFVLPREVLRQASRRLEDLLY